MPGERLIFVIELNEIFGQRRRPQGSIWEEEEEERAR